MVALVEPRWNKACPNAAAALVSQTNHPVLIEGVPGVGKSSVMFQWAKAMEREAIYLIGSTHAPEDFRGLPFISDCKSFFSMTPPKWAERLSRPGGLLILDELTTVTPSVRAALLSMLTEWRLGELTIHPDTIMLAACNPASMAPNASPLEKSVVNRFWHWQWQWDFEAWSAGMVSEDDNFQPRWIPQVPANWRRFVPEMGSLIVSYCRKNAGDRVRVPDNDEELAYPTPRTWKYLRDVMAAAKATGAPPNIQRELCEGMVGKTTGRNFLQYVSQLDLVDPEEVLSGRAQFSHDRKRPDLTVALLTSIVTAIHANYSEERMDAAVDLFCSQVGKDTADLVLTQVRHLVQARPEGTQLSKKSMAALKEFGSRIPEHLKRRKAGV